MHKIGLNSLRFADHLYLQRSLQHLLPQDFQLQLCKMPTHATMTPKAKREMLPYIFSIDDEAVGASNNLVVSVARDVSHHNFIASPDLLVPYREIVHSGPAHMRDRRLVSYNLGYRPGH